MPTLFSSQILKLSIFLTILGFLGPIRLLCHASLPPFQSEVSEVACMVSEASSLEEIKNDLSGRLGHCSGTFINSNLFLTAAHCLGDKPSNLGLLNSTKQKRIFISCPGSKDYPVVATIPNLNYYKKIMISDVGEIEISTAFSESAPVEAYDAKSDLALLIVKSGPKVSHFPMIIKAAYDSLSCQILGYASRICNRQTGSGCLREVKFELGADESIRIPYGIIAHGDSGSGILCQTNGITSIVGINTQPEWPLTLHSNAKFLNQYTSLGFDELYEAAKKIKVSKNSWELFETENRIKALTGNEIAFKCYNTVAKCSKFWTQSLQIVTNNKLLSLLLAKEFKEVIAMSKADPSEAPMRRGDRRYELYVNPHATTNELMLKLESW